ncbi:MULTISPECIES: hypothetical protein [Pseudomonas]|uniref:hypothetical protein n=1 Tax=Pseudomonas TaxID=286 RepID=UPI0013CF2FF6|nr:MULTISPECIES: hypothetical protein [Pseudomonas]
MDSLFKAARVVGEISVGLRLDGALSMRDMVESFPDAASPVDAGLVALSMPMSLAGKCRRKGLSTIAPSPPEDAAGLNA